MEAIFRHAIFCSTTETTDNHIVKIGVASATCRPVVKTVSRYTILCSAVEAPDYHLFVCHCDPQRLFILSSFTPEKSISLLYSFRARRQIPACLSGTFSPKNTNLSSGSRRDNRVITEPIRQAHTSQIYYNFNTDMIFPAPWYRYTPMMNSVTVQSPFIKDMYEKILSH